MAVSLLFSIQRTDISWRCWRTIWVAAQSSRRCHSGSSSRSCRVLRKSRQNKKQKPGTAMPYNLWLRRRLQLLASVLLCCLLGYLTSAAVAKPTLSFSLPQGLQGFPSFQSFTQQIIEQRSVRQMKTYRWVEYKGRLPSTILSNHRPLPWTSRRRGLAMCTHKCSAIALTYCDVSMSPIILCFYLFQREAGEQRLAHYDILSRSDHSRYGAGTPEAVARLWADRNLVSI